MQVIDRLIDHPSARIRAATIAARSVLDPDSQPLLMRMSFEESPEVRATITVNLIASGEIFGEDARDRVEGLIRSGSAGTRVALANAIGRRGALGFADVLVSLARAKEPEVRRAAAEAMGTVHDPRFIPALVELLPEEDTRPLAHSLLVTYGEGALSALVAALDDRERAPRVRWRIAQTIPLFDYRLSSAALLSLLGREDDGAVRFQIIRGLASLVRRHPDLSLDRALLEDAITATVRRAYRYLERRISLTRGAAEVTSRKTPGHELLVKVLADKERNAEDRLFRLLGLAYPLEDFVEIYRGIVGGRRDARASAMELVGSVLEEPMRGAVVGLVDDIADDQRAQAAGPFRSRVPVEYEALLAQLLESTSESVQSVAVYHIGELRLGAFRDRISLLRAGEVSRGLGAGSDVERTLARLADRAGGGP